MARSTSPRRLFRGLGRPRNWRAAPAYFRRPTPEIPAERPQIRLPRLHLVAMVLHCHAAAFVAMAAIVWRARFSAAPQTPSTTSFAIASQYPAQGIFRCFPDAETAPRSSRKPLHTASRTAADGRVVRQSGFVPHHSRKHHEEDSHRHCSRPGRQRRLGNCRQHRGRRDIHLHRLFQRRRIDGRQLRHGQRTELQLGHVEFGDRKSTVFPISSGSATNSCSRR